MTKSIHMLIKDLRKQTGMSQSSVAHELGMSRPTYIQMENGKREPTVSDIQKMAGIFGVSVGTFLGEAGSGLFSVSLPDEKKPKEARQPDMRINVPQKNLEKFTEVLLYVLEKVGAKPNVGETVIYKLLYFIDFDFYEKYERQLIGATYIKNHHGPTPVEFKKIIDRMKENGEIEVVRSKYFQYEQKKYLPRRSSDLKKLTAEEKEHIDGVLARLSDKSAKELSDYSHADVPWKIHQMGEALDYESVFYRDYSHSVRDHNDEL